MISYKKDELYKELDILISFLKKIRARKNFTRNYWITS